MESTQPAVPLRASWAGLLVISAAILTLEVLQTRLFSYSFETLLFYAAVAVALLGLGASGTVLCFWQGWRRLPIGSVGAVSSVGFAVTVILSHVYFAHVSAQVTFGFNVACVVLFIVLAVPYFFAGTTVTVCLAAAGSGIHGAYLVNLVGSALGCFVVFVALKPLGAPVLVAAVALTGILAALFFLSSGAGKRARRLTFAGAIVAAAPLVAPDAVFPFAPEPYGQLNLLIRIARQAPAFRADEELVYGSWDPTGRIEHHRFGNIKAMLPEPVPFLFYSQDGTAGSVVLGVGDDISRAAGFFDRTLYGAAYHIRGAGNTRKVLIIGLGGGPDVLAAHHFQVPSVTGVEINASSIEAVRGPLAEFAGNPYGRPGTNIVQMDGRSFVRSSRESFDLIVLSGVDTKAVLAAGSMAVSENHVYTIEAFGEYFDHLAPGGHLAFLRFGTNDRLRLVSTGVAALREREVEHPEDHFVVLKQGSFWTSVIIGRDPIDAKTRRRLTEWVAGIPNPTGILIPVYDALFVELSLAAPPQILHPRKRPIKGRDVGRFFRAVENGTEEEFLSAGHVNLSPTTDDRPFFFDSQRPELIFSRPLHYYRKLFALLGIMILLAGLSIVAPIPLFMRRGISGGGGVRAVLYFLCLGLGFITLEIGLVQKLVLFLGHQSYAITVVLSTLLVSAGLGSACAGRLRGDAARLVRARAVPAILIAGILLMLVLDHAAHIAAPLPLFARIGLTALFLFPLGFALGIPFPTALAVLSERTPARVPWAIGANGFASVIGSTAALPVAMICGYRVLIFAAFAIYVLAALLFPPSGRAVHEVGQQRG